MAGPLVLLVDDDPDNRSMYADYLELRGYRVIEAGDGLEAVALAGTHRPDAIILDLMLPGIDGYEATRRLRAAERDMVVIAVSGRVDSDSKRRALEAGVTAFLDKPCLPDVLETQLRQLLG